MPKKKAKTWTKKRHQVIRTMASWVFYPFVRFKYGAKIEKVKDGKRQYLILFNHQTEFDQFFVSLAFKKHVYYLASEDLFSNGVISTLLRWAVAPIPIKKQATDVRAVMNCIKIAKEGGNVALAPEGNRTYSGKTEYINPAICGLIKALKLPVAFFKIEGGYGVAPRWGSGTRKGNMRGYVSKVMEYEEVSSLSDQELLDLVKTELYVNEGNETGEFKSKTRAEYIERVLYVCPHCGFTTFESDKNLFRCKKCGLEVEYLPNKRLKATKGEIPFEFFTQWYDYQADYMNKSDLSKYGETPLYEEVASLFKVTLYKSKKKIQKDAKIKLYYNKIEILGNQNFTFDFDSLSAVAVLGRNKLNLYTKDGLFQVKGSKRFNAVKYVHTYYHYINEKRGEKDGKLLFLGL